MRTVKIRLMSLEEAAQALVTAAPARGDFWGVPMRARFATTRPSDVVMQYKRTIRMAAMSYGNRLPVKQRARLVCVCCGARDCKLWREYRTCGPGILCGPCALLHEGEMGEIDADGKRVTDVGRCDQIGSYVPAVPDVEGYGFWCYASAPQDACEWWRMLPSYPRSAVAG